jgi:GDP-4-dehydro-6-deoxy-D-mannose reductase
MPASETTPLRPLSPYAASKVEAEQLGREAARNGLAVMLLRPFNHLGRGQAPQFVMPSFARQLVAIAMGQSPPVVEVGDLSPVRDFSHVEDVVAAYLLLLERGVPGEVYNVCSGEGLSIRQALDALQELAGTRAEIRVDPARLRPTEIPWLVGNPGKLARLGWNRRRHFRDALADVVEEARA